MRSLAGIFLLVFGLVSATAVSADVSRKDTRSFLERSGVAEKVRNADAILKTRVDEVLAEMPEQVPGRWLDQTKEMFSSLIDPQTILALLERGLAEELSQSDLAALNDFYESPLARRIAALESSASTPAAIDRIEESFDALEARLDRNPVREELLGRLDRARRYSEIEAALAAASLVGFTQGVTAVVGEAPEIPYDIQFSAFRISFLDKLRYENAIPLIYTYGPITDSEIEQYLTLLNAPAAQKFYDTIERIHQKYYRAAGSKLADAVADLFSDLASKVPAADETPKTDDDTPTTSDETPTKAGVTLKAAGELLERSGAAKLMSRYASDREVNASTVPYALDFESVHPDIRDAFVGLFRQWVDAGFLIDLAEHGLADSLSEDDVDTLNAFYTSPLGKRIVALEGAATTQQAMNRVRRDMEELAAQLKDDPVRGMLLGELDNVLRRSEADVSLAAAVYTGFGKALDRPADGESSFDEVFEDARREFIEGVRAQQGPAMERTYGALTDDEILEYLRFLKTDSAKKFHILLESAVTLYVMEHGKVFAEAFAKVLEQKKEQ